MKQVYQSRSINAIVIGIVCILIPLTDCKKFEPERIDPDDLYTVTINNVSNVTYNSCTLNGELVTMKGQNITQHGFCWSESNNPTIENGDKNELGSRTSTGNFSSTISGLTTNTTYYARAYVTDKYAGTVYGEEKSFTTSISGETVTDYDGNVYQTAVIGEQIWMAENLQVTHFADGTPIPYVENDTSWEALYAIGKAYCWYENDTAYGNTYGALYTWATAMNGTSSTDVNPSGIQGVCPDGWHLPSDSEWKQLEMALGMSQEEANKTDWRGSDEAGKLKEVGTAHWASPNIGANNESGFTALPGGLRSGEGWFDFIGNIAYFWTATESSSLSAWERLLHNDSELIARDINHKGRGFSVRCVKGAANTSLPSITATNISSITDSSAQAAAEVSSDGGAEVIAYGFCWSTFQNPTTSDSCTTNGTGTGTFSSSITGLDCNTTYYVRAYAINSVGTEYGAQNEFTTSECTVIGETVTDYDGNVYQTVVIGEQIWMQENLKVMHYADGTAIPLVESSTAWDSLGNADKAYCWNENSTTNRDTYGGLYTWAAAMNGAGSSEANPSGVQGVCPSGWHLPSDAEWTDLIDFLGGSFVAGGKLKETGLSHWGDPNAGATNESEFTALPSGYRSTRGVFGIGNSGVWWSTLGSTADRAWSRGMSSNDPSVFRGSNDRDRGQSVRCVKGQGYSVPTVTTGEINNITYTSADAGGNVTDDGGLSVIEKGVCYSTDPNPTIDDDNTIDGSGIGSFSSSISGLTPDTIYYIRAYAYNVVGTGYGDEVSFTTLASSITDYDGNTYQIVAIGDQVWMAENLKVTHYHDGTVIPLEEDNLVWDGLDNNEKAYCWYDNNDTLGIIHGALYNWAGAMNGAGSSDTNPSGIQGVCPAGWHLPSDAEWTQLIDYLGGETIAAGKMKESGFEHWNSPNTGATNESGFTALASGYRFYGEFYDMGGYTNFWTAMESTSTKAWTRFLYYDSAGLQRTLAEKRGGLSVRCVKNE